MPSAFGKLILTLSVALAGWTSACHAQQETAAPVTPPQAPEVTATQKMLADTLASVVRDAIPHQYARKKEWGQTKRITVGVTTDEPIYKLKLHRRKKAVSHGTWKQYRIKFVDPQQKLHIAVENLHSLAGGGVGLRLVMDAELDGWAQMRHYNRGIHLLTLTAEGRSRLRLVVDCEVRVAMGPKGMAIDPRVTASRLDIHDFQLQRFGELEGKLAEELGDGLKHVMRDQLDGPKLTAKLNRAIDKKRDRFVVSAADLLPSW
ncbi:hypothetical protein NG895_19190 [Aeoliella sp. ICT_H6.2]|uniref:Uncharacterized protein n=1 Tax=Aeoliella straminimaris TaxID=2954799 RepID=A0A9X2JHG5_9BACT|nr:hypothetical protein [Aeoliella straminimaris]MCO6046030.1 hypothetical protein [Aeoliella straminimaris]